MKQITVVNQALSRIAAEQLGDARQWPRIALANGLYTPVVLGAQTINIPPVDPNAPKGLPQ